mgnify:FL=1
MPSFSHPRVVQLLVLDVDGVLTDGSIWVGQDGYELKRFHVRDGLGIKIWQRLGYEVAVISGRSSLAVERRMQELGVKHLYQGIRDKVGCLSELIDRCGVTLAQVAYIGDDWPDAGVLKRVGFPIVVADAEEGLKKLGAFVTTRRGGEGAVREAIDYLLMGKGRTEKDREEMGTDGSERASPKSGVGPGTLKRDPDAIFPEEGR